MLDVDFALRSDRTMKALTGLRRIEFQQLGPVFGQALSKQMHSRRPDRQRKPGGGGKYRLDRVEAKLFFILMYVKCYPTFDVASVLYQVHRSRPHRWVQTWLPVLEQALGYAVVLPERRIDQVETFFTRFPQVKDLWLDGTERPIRRPQDPGRQKRHYSGKKKRHTHNNLLLTDADRRVLALSPTQPGARHDYALLTSQRDLRCREVLVISNARVGLSTWVSLALHHVEVERSLLGWSLLPVGPPYPDCRVELQRQPIPID